MEKDVLEEIASLWGVESCRERTDIDIQGSPNRSDERAVIEDGKTGEKYLISGFSKDRLASKERIAFNLQKLKDASLSRLFPYQKSKNSNFHESVAGKYWQCSLFLSGEKLKRPSYVHDAWRGEKMVAYLNELRKVEGSGLELQSEDFSIVKHIEDLIDVLEKHKPEVFERVQPVIDFLKREFFSAHAELPLRFSHGDYHVMNVIWEASDIKAVIDWEFCGFKPEAYDAANLIGCIGIEDPDYLTAEMATAIMREIERTEFFSPLTKKYFIEYLIAQRFGWLSEWLLISDNQMVDMELVYMHILMNNADFLREYWRV